MALTLGPKKLMSTEYKRSVIAPSTDPAWQSQKIWLNIPFAPQGK